MDPPPPAKPSGVRAMIERKYVSVFVAAFVLMVAVSGAGTIAVLSDSQTVSVQLEPGNVTASLVENATGTGQNASATEETVETVTIDEVEGLIVALEPANGTADTDGTRLQPEEQSIATNEKMKYDVVVKGATDGIAGYYLTVGLTDSSVATIEDFEHNYEFEIQNKSVQDGEVTFSAGAMEPLNGTDEYTLGTITVDGSAAGQTDLTIAKTSGITGMVSGNASLYNVSVWRGGTLAMNDPPTAEDDAYDVSKNGALTVTSEGGVLANDSDPNGHDLTATVTDGPAHGTLELTANGSVRYTPDEGFTGEDTFTYEVRDGHGGADTASVTITVEE